MIQYHAQDGGPDELWRDYEAIFNTPCVQKSDAQRDSALTHLVLFLALTEHSIEQNTALHGLLTLHKKAVAALPAYECVVAAARPPWPLARLTPVAAPGA